MNFFADESVDHPIVVRLREDGHNVLAVAEITPSIPDETVFTQANQRGDLLITADKDFGEIVLRQTTGDRRGCSHSLGGIVARDESENCFRHDP